MLDNGPDDLHEPIQIVMHEALVPAFKDWLASRHLHLAGPISADPDDLPFYIIGINDDHPANG